MKRINIIIITLVLSIIFMGIQVAAIMSASKFEPEISVVYAACDIPYKTKIEDNMLKMQKVKINLITKNTIRDKAQIIGKKAKVFIDSGEMVLTDKIGSPDEMEEIKVLDPKNRLFACEFKPDQANGWWLLVDQKVDIIYIPIEKQAIAKPDDTTMPEVKLEKLPDESVSPTASIIADNSDIPIKYKKIENVRIAAILDDKFQLLDNKKRDTTPKYISFEVTPTQDAILAYAKGNGRLELSVIPSGD